MKSTVLVVALKYNDILYGISTEEFKEACHKKLVILYSSGNKPEDYPLQDMFDQVKYIDYCKDVVKMYRNIWHVKTNRQYWISDTIMMCNPTLLIAQMIYKYSNAKKVIWLEDGLMNYYPITNIHYKVPRFIKSLVQRLLRLKDIDKSNAQLITYLLSPSYAESYWGEICKLIPNKSIFNQMDIASLSFLKGKKIFVGQPIYKEGVMSEESYYKLVNSVIRENGIDYYLAHFYSSNQESIDCQTVAWKDLGMTMEFIACMFDFHLYSFSSTLLYSTKFLNNKVKTTMIDIGWINQNIRILRDTVDDIIYRDEIKG